MPCSQQARVLIDHAIGNADDIGVARIEESA